MSEMIELHKEDGYEVEDVVSTVTEKLQDGKVLSDLTFEEGVWLMTFDPAPAKETKQARGFKFND